MSHKHKCKKKHYDAIIIRDAKAYAISFATVQEIDKLNILQATLLAMKRAVEALNCFI